MKRALLTLVSVIVMGLSCQIGCLANESTQAIPKSSACEDVGKKEAQRTAREFFGFWKSLYPEFINEALSKMSASNWTYQGKLSEDGSLKGSFVATLEIRDTARPEFSGMSQYYYDAAEEAVRKMALLREQRQTIKTGKELQKQLEDLVAELNRKNPGSAKLEESDAQPGKALLVVYREAPFRLDEQVGPFQKGFRGYLTTVLVLDVTDVLDKEDRETNSEGRE